MSSPVAATDDHRAEAPLRRRGERLERDALLLGVPVALAPAVVVALVVHPLVGVLVAAAVIALWVIAVRRRVLHADERVLSELQAREIAAGEHPRLENLVDGLCSTNGVAPPTLRLIDSPGANAAVAAVDERVTFVVTCGLLEGLDRMELEGVVANLVVRARDGSAGYTTLVLSLLGTSTPAMRRLADAYGDQRAVRSDLAAVELTRYPPGLRRAIGTMEALGTAVRPEPRTSRMLWIAPSAAAPAESGPDRPAAVASNEQPLALRAAVLSEL